MRTFATLLAFLAVTGHARRAHIFGQPATSRQNQSMEALPASYSFVEADEQVRFNPLRFPWFKHTFSHDSTVQKKVRRHLLVNSIGQDTSERGEAKQSEEDPISDAYDVLYPKMHAIASRWMKEVGLDVPMRDLDAANISATAFACASMAAHLLKAALGISSGSENEGMPGLSKLELPVVPRRTVIQALSAAVIGIMQPACASYALPAAAQPDCRELTSVVSQMLEGFCEIDSSQADQSKTKLQTLVAFNKKPAVDSSQDLEAYALSQPALELTLMDEAASRRPGETDQDRDMAIAKLVFRLEGNGGSQIGASGNPGRWSLPWVGGWERVWSPSFNENDSFMGGPTKQSFSKGGSVLEKISCRHFVYGPGEGGIVVEYLHAVNGDADAPIKILLTRPGAVANLGNNVFELEFPTPLVEYQTQYDKSSRSPSDTLLSDKPLPAGSESAAAITVKLRTTYLSERLWIVRGENDPTKVAVFERTETRSVLDRRGLVAEGQLKPPADETIRYGRLLFGNELSDYAGWDEKAIKAQQEKQKLFDTNSER